MELLHHPVVVGVPSAAAGMSPQPAVGAVLTAAERARLGALVAMVQPGMTFADVSSCGEQRDISAVAVGAVRDGGHTEQKPAAGAWAGQVQVLELGCAGASGRLCGAHQRGVVSSGSHASAVPFGHDLWLQRMLVAAPSCL